jgi:hypothetical protein
MNTPIATETPAAGAEARKNGSGVPQADPPAGRDRVVTKLRFNCTPEKAWQNLMFYEQIERRPPLHLLALLPKPIRTEGRKSEVGDVATCLYEGGHLLKRVDKIEENRYYGFTVVEQTLKFGGGMLLSKGAYTLTPRPDGGTDVAVETNYTSTRKPRALWRPIEALVAHSFHRFILKEMRRAAEA